MSDFAVALRERFLGAVERGEYFIWAGRGQYSNRLEDVPTVEEIDAYEESLNSNIIDQVINSEAFQQAIEEAGGGGLPGLKVLATQAEGDNPLIVRMVNTIDAGTATLVRDSKGQFLLTLTGAFPPNRTFVKVSSGSSDASGLKHFSWARASVNSILIYCWTSGGETEDYSNTVNPFSVDVEILPE